MSTDIQYITIMLDHLKSSLNPRRSCKALGNIGIVHPDVSVLSIDRDRPIKVPRKAKFLQSFRSETFISCCPRFDPSSDNKWRKSLGRGRAELNFGSHDMNIVRTTDPNLRCNLAGLKHCGKRLMGNSHCYNCSKKHFSRSIVAFHYRYCTKDFFRLRRYGLVIYASSHDLLKCRNV